MESVIVTVKRQGEAQVRDLEVPLDITAGELAQQMAAAFGWSSDYQVYAAPPERVLPPQETLLQAGVWDGAWLVFQPAGTPAQSGGLTAASPPPGPAPQPDKPVGGWIPLGVSTSSTPPDEAPPPSSGGFVWKQIDED